MIPTEIGGCGSVHNMHDMYSVGPLLTEVLYDKVTLIPQILHCRWGHFFCRGYLPSLLTWHQGPHKLHGSVDMYEGVVAHM